MIMYRHLACFKLLGENHQGRCRSLGLALLLLLVLGLALAPSASAQSACAHPGLVAHAALVLGKQTHAVSASSPGGGYAMVCCRYFVVDVAVPADSSGTGNDLKSFYIETEPALGSVGPPDESDCTAIRGKTAVYKNVGGSFQLIAQWEAVGVWDPSLLFPCTIEAKQGATLLPALNPPASNYDVYRVVTSSKFGAQWVTARVDAGHLSP
jgi:hypothetical protein